MMRGFLARPAWRQCPGCRQITDSPGLCPVCWAEVSQPPQDAATRADIDRFNQKKKEEEARERERRGPARRETDREPKDAPKPTRTPGFEPPPAPMPGRRSFLGGLH